MKNKKTIVAIISAALVIGGGVASVSSQSSSSCVNVYIDYGVLKNHSKFTECVPVSEKINALTVLKRSGIEVVGTNKYGSQIVCRVNNLPSSTDPVNISGHENYVEPCTDMPPEFAYWAVLVKRNQTIPNPIDVSGKWNWADTGIADVKLNPGDSIGLVFSDNEKVNFPD